MKWAVAAMADVSRVKPRLLACAAMALLVLTATAVTLPSIASAQGHSQSGQNSNAAQDGPTVTVSPDPTPVLGQGSGAYANITISGTGISSDPSGPDGPVVVVSLCNSVPATAQEALDCGGFSGPNNDTNTQVSEVPDPDGDFSVSASFGAALGELTIPGICYPGETDDCYVAVLSTSPTTHVYNTPIVAPIDVAALPQCTTPPVVPNLDFTIPAGQKFKGQLTTTSGTAVSYALQSQSFATSTDKFKFASTGAYSIEPPSAKVDDFTYTATDSNGCTSNVGTITLTATATADLALKVTRNVPTVLNGQIVRYTISLQNLGPSPATGVVVTGTLAQYLTMYTRATIGKSQCTAGSTFTCSLETMAVGGSTNITFQAVGIGNSQGSASDDITVNVTSTSDDPKTGNNAIDQKITADAPAVSADLPSDPAFPNSTGDDSSLYSLPSPASIPTNSITAPQSQRSVSPALHNKLPSDCPAGLKSVPVGKGSYNGCIRTFCGADGTGSGDGFGGVRVDAWESGQSGINEFQVTYELWDSQNGWEESGLTPYTDTSYVVPDNSGTNWYVAYHQFNFTIADTGDAFRVAYDVKWLHKGHLGTSTVEDTGLRWDTAETCIAS